MLLREHDYPGMRLVALRFAYKLTRSRTRAQDLTGRADLRLVRQGWDPGRVSLVKALCRNVWSEWTHAHEETKAARRAEQGYLRELEVTEGFEVPPTEAHVIALETAHESKTVAEVQLEKLRALFEQKGDEVNLQWLTLRREGVTDAETMATKSGRAVADFYAAARRRKRAVLQLLANDRGVCWEKEDS